MWPSAWITIYHSPIQIAILILILFLAFDWSIFLSNSWSTYLLVWLSFFEIHVMDDWHQILPWAFGSYMPQLFAVDIYCENLPQLFAVAIFRGNFPQLFAVAICCENLQWLFVVDFLYVQIIFFCICEQILFIWKQIFFTFEQNFYILESFFY